MRLRKALFVLPNLFTVSSIFCGFYALSLCGETGRPDRFYQAALAILFAVFFDAFDGRVARMTKTQSEFGMHLDSLADVVSFGAAPALLAYRWALAPLGFWGLSLSFVFAACGALRLARFNVLATHHYDPRFFVGLPIPLAAGAVISLVIARGVTDAPVPVGPIGAIVILLSYLMVSNVRYRTFKETQLTRNRAALLFLAAGAAVVSGVQFGPSAVLVALIAAYIVVGLLEQGLSSGRRRAERRRIRAAVGGDLMQAATGQDDEDDEGDFV